MTELPPGVLVLIIGGAIVSLAAKHVKHGFLVMLASIHLIQAYNVKPVNDSPVSAFQRQAAEQRSAERMCPIDWIQGDGLAQFSCKKVLVRECVDSTKPEIVTTRAYGQTIIVGCKEK